MSKSGRLWWVDREEREPWCEYWRVLRNGPPALIKAIRAPAHRSGAPMTGEIRALEMFASLPAGCIAYPVTDRNLFAEPAYSEATDRVF